MKFKIGMKVKIRTDLSENKSYPPGINPDMIELAGKFAKIIELHEESCILDIDNGEYLWSEDMIEQQRETQRTIE